MSNPAPSSASTASSGRLVGPILGFIVFVCVAMIGFSGYVKYQLDKAEATLAAPDVAIAADQDAFEKLRRVLGYSGFVGSAQNFLATGDRALVADMKAQVKMAEDMIERLPEKTPAEARHDLQSILDTFEAALKKADQPGTGVPATFTSADMQSLYATLPVLDSRVDSALATSRLAAQDHLKWWAMLLTFVAWTGLMIAAACAASLYLGLRGQHAVPLRALAQSVQNMARGDMQIPIWGIQRPDIIGELARAVDMARYHFSQLPDLSVMSEQGPMRIRFEGHARSLFEAMMQHIARDSEQVREQASHLTETVVKQKESITQIAGRVEMALETLHNKNRGSHEDLSRVVHGIAGAAQSMQKTQEYAAAQLGRITSTLQERAQGMTELTQLAGKQMTQSLQALDRTEHGLRMTAEQHAQTVQRLSSSADELNDRMAGAIALLRAGGKVLNETAEATQSRLNEAVDLLGRSQSGLRQIVAAPGNMAPDAAAKPMPMIASEAQQDPLAMQRLKIIVGNLEIAQRKLEECLAQQAEATHAQIELLTTHSNSLLSQATTAAQTLISATDNLRGEREKIDQATGQLMTTVEHVGTALEERINDSFGKLSELSAQFDPVIIQLGALGQLTNALGSVAAALGPLNPATIAAQGTATDNLMTEVKAGFEVTSRSIERVREEFLNLVLKQAPPENTAAAMQSQIDRIAAQVETARENLTQSMIREVDRIEMRLAGMDKKKEVPTPEEANVAADTQAQLQQQAQILSELAAALGAIDAHMQEIEKTLHSAQA
jgi:methyl-accepting chemotaxis protein